MVKAFITVKSIDEFGPGKTRMIAVPRRAPNKVKLNDLTLKNLKPRDASVFGLGHRNSWPHCAGPTLWAPIHQIHLQSARPTALVFDREDRHGAC
jgi:hypothetical protein